MDPRVGPISLGIAPRACMILSKLLLLLRQRVVLASPVTAGNKLLLLLLPPFAEAARGPGTRRREKRVDLGME